MIEVKKAGTQPLKDKAFAIRKEVFVVEQKVSEEDEFDSHEEESIHFVALNDHQEPVGAARWRKTDKGIKLERFSVKKSYRGQGVGKLLVREVLSDIETQGGEQDILYLHAQLDAVSLYEKFGFEKKGPQFLECDIWHYLMIKPS